MEVLNQFDQIGEIMDENTITDDNVGVILEEAEIIDCDTEIEAITEEENIQYQLCQVNKDDNTVAYRVVQVNDNQVDNSQLSITAPATNAVQLLTSPINGQFYVLGNGTELLESETSQSVTPCVAKLQIEPTQNVIGMMKRRVTHNEVERRRRDKINNWIAKLGKLLPDSEKNANGEGDVKPNVEAQSKSGILARACEYITELRKAQENLTQSLDENTQLLEEVKTLRQVVNQLKKANSQLKAQMPDDKYILGS